MTQLNIATVDLGWGDLKSNLDELKSLRMNLQKDEEKARKDRNNLHYLIEKINKERRKRVLDLLKAEKRAICLLHPLVFRESVIEESLAPEELVLVVQMYSSWTRSEGEYDGDRELVHYGNNYETTACKLCRSVVSHGSVTDKKWTEHGMMRDQKPSAKTCEEFYPVKIIDMVSEEYFQMPIVNIENLQSL